MHTHIYVYLLIRYCLFVDPMMVVVEFKSPNITVNESDGFVKVELLRAGNHSDSFNIGISVTMIAEPAIVQCMYVCTYLCVNMYVPYSVCTCIHTCICKM